MEAHKQLIVFDLDNTVYTKDSIIQFHRFILSRAPWRILFLPLQLLGYALYLAGILRYRGFKNFYLLFLAFYKSATLKKLIREFWEEEYPEHFNETLLDIVSQCQANEIEAVLLSSSPEIYVSVLAETIGFSKVISTPIKRRGYFYFIDGKSCKGHEKVRQLKKHYPDSEVMAAYSDTLFDKPVFDLAERAFLVTEKKLLSYK